MFLCISLMHNIYLHSYFLRLNSAGSQVKRSHAKHLNLQKLCVIFLMFWSSKRSPLLTCSTSCNFLLMITGDPHIFTVQDFGAAIVKPNHGRRITLWLFRIKSTSSCRRSWFGTFDAPHPQDIKPFPRNTVLPSGVSVSSGLWEGWKFSRCSLLRILSDQQGKYPNVHPNLPSWRCGFKDFI